MLSHVIEYFPTFQTITVPLSSEYSCPRRIRTAKQNDRMYHIGAGGEWVHGEPVGVVVICARQGFGIVASIGVQLSYMEGGVCVRNI